MIKAKIGDLLKKILKDKHLQKIEIFTPENEKFGHYSTNLALKIGKIKKENPLQTAKELAQKISDLKTGLFEKVEVASPGFLNFWLSEKTIHQELAKILKLKEKYGSGSTDNKTIIIEYSSPNIAKPMTVGHLRSTIIGQAIANLLKFHGYKTVQINHPGDWGTQFGALIYSYKTWGEEKKMEKNPIDYLVKLYVRFHKEAEQNKELMAKAKQEIKKLQDGDPENKKLWKIFTQESQKEFEKIYSRLGVKFDSTLGESFYQPQLGTIVKEALE